MKPQRGDLLEVVEVDGLPVPAAAHGDRAPTGDTVLGDTGLGRFLLRGTDAVRRRLDRWSWWRRADPAHRVWAAATATLVVLTLATTGAAARHHVRTVTVTRTVVTPAAPSGVDALGCPVNRRCGVRAAAGMRTAVHRALPRLTVVTTSETYDLDGGRVYRRELLALAVRPQAALRLVAQCVADGFPITDDVQDLLSANENYTLTVGRRVTMSFAPGCSSFAYYTERLASPTATPVTPRERISAIVSDPAIRVAP